MATEWYDDDAFWATFEPFLFSDGHWDRGAEEIERCAILARANPGASVLDLCCGPGRHSLELARLGYRVTGVDRTAQYLARARAAARAEDLDVEFVQADMREFSRPNEYDLALSLYTSFGYFRDPEEDRRVAANLCSSLRPGGVLVMDLMGKEVLARIFTKRSWDQGPDGKLLLQERELSDSWSWIENRWIAVDGGDVREHRFGHRLYSAAELRGLLRGVGFGEVATYGDLDGGAYDHAAQRLVAVAVKPLPE